MSFLLGSLYYFDSDLDSDLFKTKPNSTQENQAQLILSQEDFKFTGESHTHTQAR